MVRNLNLLSSVIFAHRSRSLRGSDISSHSCRGREGISDGVGSDGSGNRGVDAGRGRSGRCRAISRLVSRILCRL